MTDWKPVRPFHDFPRVEADAFDTRQSIFVPDLSITDSKVAPGISPRKLQGIGTKVYNSAAQTITTSTQTAITFDTEVYDTGNFWNSSDNTKVYMPFDGVYALTAYAEFNTSPTGTFRRLLISLNGATNVCTMNMFPLTGIATQASLSVSQRFTKGDYVTMEVNHDRGSNLNVNGGEANNFLVVNFLFAI